MRGRECFIKKIIKFISLGSTAVILNDVPPRYLVVFNGWLHGSVTEFLSKYLNDEDTFPTRNGIETALKNQNRIFFLHSKTKFVNAKYFRSRVLYFGKAMLNYSFSPRKHRKILISLCDL